MRTIKYLLALIVLVGLTTSCDTDIEAKVIQTPYTYSDLYYQNLRDYKASDHPISFGWFAQYGAQNSMAVRFLGLPDSLDICSLWGGIPSKENTQIWEELRFVQKVKGTKMFAVAITRIDAETDDKEFKQYYNAAKELPYGEERDAAINRAIEMYADYFLDQVFENDLDGFDADYEPEGDFLDGSYFIYFMEYLAQYMGPNPNITKEERLKLIQARYGNDMTDTDKMLCVDCPGNAPLALQDICNYHFKQSYGKAPSTNWSSEKVVYCCNMGDDWQEEDAGGLYTYASYKPTNGKKGGFGAFFIHRDYNIHEYSTSPYKRFEECIQIQNPAVY